MRYNEPFTFPILIDLVIICNNRNNVCSDSILWKTKQITVDNNSDTSTSTLNANGLKYTN